MHSLYDTLCKARQMGNSGTRVTLVMVTRPACDVLYLAYNMCAYICMCEMLMPPKHQVSPVKPPH